MLTHSPSIIHLATAMRAVQMSVGTVPTDSTNPHFRNKYASLAAVNDAIREHYLAAGLAVMQAPGSYAGGIMTLTTLIVHAESGEWLSNEMQLPVAKTDPQGAGSALTYAERYSLMALFNLPPVDDDAEAAIRPPSRPAADTATDTTPTTAAKKPTHPAESAAERTRLMQSLKLAKTRTALVKWREREDVQASMNLLTEKDSVFFNAEYGKAWKALPEALTMAG